MRAPRWDARTVFSRVVESADVLVFPRGLHIAIVRCCIALMSCEGEPDMVLGSRARFSKHKMRQLTR